MFFSKRKSSLTPKPSLRPDLHSTYRSKCDARTILSAMQDKSKEKRYSHNRRQNCWLVTTQNAKLFCSKPILSPLPLLSLLLPLSLPPPTAPMHNASLLIFILKRWTKERGSFSILCRIMSRKVAAVHLLRNIKSQITSKWSQLFVALHRKIQSKCVLNLAYLTRVINR